jgi:hypothetical protein
MKSEKSASRAVFLIDRNGTVISTLWDRYGHVIVQVLPGDAGGHREAQGLPHPRAILGK